MEKENEELIRNGTDASELAKYAEIIKDGLKRRKTVSWMGKKNQKPAWVIKPTKILQSIIRPMQERRREQKIFAELLTMTREMHRKLSYRPYNQKDRDNMNKFKRFHMLQRYYEIVSPVYEKFLEVSTSDIDFKSEKGKLLFLSLKEFFETDEAIGPEGTDIYKVEFQYFIAIKKKSLSKILDSLTK